LDQNGKNLALAGMLSGRFAASIEFPNRHHEEKATSQVESLPYIAVQIAGPLIAQEDFFIWPSTVDSFCKAAPSPQ
jgi:hypothetical protein